MLDWSLLILGLPTANATERMRAWRTLKASGAAVLRDGVYLLPEKSVGREAFQAVQRDVMAINGTAYLLSLSEREERFSGLFDRSDEYEKLLEEIAGWRADLSLDNALQIARQVRKLRKAFGQLAAIDFFPGVLKAQTDSALQALETSISRALSPDEPRAHDEAITQLERSEYQGRRWATRKRPWVDRLACAWLIRRFIDPDARFIWLDSPGDCPSDALGFDFDGAMFSHVGQRVSFETLIESFAVQQPGLARLAGVVHYLDVGGYQPSEAPGIERVLAGLRERIGDDDQLTMVAGGIFDGLLTAFAIEETPNG
ncbi:chromate resistance protein ChrB domain-containing protein [Pseudomonas sp. FYR_2]|uniref:Chromate resistance protein n=2 Tax=Pseudomonas TaxID=286 RepID=A0A7X3EYF2_9PSED|nr:MULTISPECIES: chromate resistance protein ChrB domain-containing protein [Pseudomonas]MBA6139851.1 chromate resistance protein [Pseudomonas monteilii]MBV4514663.1 chromate resistance protein [Pseudomonas kurunegalensis]MBZ3665308.1 chromate resistance protein [Pseudomonas monteilii]MBZ3670652.1 chromate resistance protein [Pseudomonas monteilii]MCA4076830.1 chromate resistance protein [Pseudomonas kurunegalensis]